MNRESKGKLGFLSFGLISLVIFPLFTRTISSDSILSQPVTVRPPNATFDAPFTQTPDAATGMPTVDPGPSPTPIVDIEEGEFYSPTYEKVDCGSIDDDLCFELCYAGQCFIYGNDDDRVQRYMDKVDDREDGIRELKILRAERGGAVFDAAGTCVQAGAGAGLAYAAAVGLLNPEPLVSKVLGGIAAVGAGIVCGGSIYDAWYVEGLKQEQKFEEIIEDSQDAIAEFNDLKDNPPK